jgi:hypothetical protein
VSTATDEVKRIFGEAKEKKDDTPVARGSQPPVTPPPTRKRAHSAYWEFRILGPESQGGEGFKRVAPGLRQEKKNEGMILLALVVLSAVISSFGGVAVYNAVHPPIQLIGVCAPPAEIRGGDCVIAETATNSQGQTSTVYVPSGIIYFINGTLYRGQP